MIPLQITLQNFLSYRQATLDFRGLHTACICGANGAGKSSLLEAMTWVIWGKTRAATEEDLIHLGEKNVRVDFEFQYNYQTFRIIRTRKRKGSSTLDFQVQNESGEFKNISEKGLRPTQDKINEYLRLDYDTFINSAYLRQGKADEFMQRSAAERKQILADLLKLDHYEELAVKAKDIAREFKGKIQEIEYSLEDFQVKLTQRDTKITELNEAKKCLKLLQSEQKKAQETLQQLQAIALQRNGLEEQLKWKETEYNKLTHNYEQTEGEIQAILAQLQELEKIVNERDVIERGFAELQGLKQEEIDLRVKFQAYQETLQQKRNLEQQLQQQTNSLTLAIQREKTNLENLERQQQELEKTLGNREKIEGDLQQLYSYRQRLNELDEIQLQIAPLQQQKLSLFTAIEREKASINAKLEQLEKRAKYLQILLAEVEQKREELLEIDRQIEELEKKSNYLKRVEEKGLTLRNYLENWETKKANLPQEIKKLQQKLDTLEQDYAICPLCEQGLNEHHLHSVREKTLNEINNIEAESWEIQEQISQGERRLLELRNEYATLSKELENYENLKQQYAKLEEQLDASGQYSLELHQIQVEISHLQAQLESDNYALELRQELQVLEVQIINLNYDEKTHILVREEEKRWRKVEFKKADLDKAQSIYNRLEQEKPQQIAKIKDLETQLQDLQNNSPIQQEIRNKEQELIKINYDENQYNELRHQLEEHQIYQSRYADLQQADKQIPVLKQKLNTLESNLKSYQEQKTGILSDIDNLKKQLDQVQDYRQDLENLTRECEQRQTEINNNLTKQGALEQTLTNLDNLQIEYNNQLNYLQEVKKKYRVYEELSKAFGKNGIQALMIENILPHLEAEANQILARLTGNQLHIQFLTQKAKSSATKKSANQFKDTLEIIISDAKGTRSYETYSGGESFRINFSIRLALARLLAQSSGTSLQLLIVDEGFGTQDAEGCERLIASLNAIASDFSCILIVTHMPQFKEAFQTRIEVYKSNDGSKLRLLT
jgi:exonuclease SbcC